MVRTSGHTVGGTGLPGRKNWITHFMLPRHLTSANDWLIVRVRRRFVDDGNRCVVVAQRVIIKTLATTAPSLSSRAKPSLTGLALRMCQRTMLHGLKSLSTPGTGVDLYIAYADLFPSEHTAMVCGAAVTVN